MSDELERVTCFLQTQHFAAAAAAYRERRERRERIATAAMQGLLAKPLPSDTTNLQIAAFAVIAADALIAELDKPKEVKP